MPAYNEEKYIEDCIRSILQQTIQPTKIILVADRCTDRTVEIATSILPMERSAILRKEKVSWHNSYSENLELARQRAVGDTFFIVDADMRLPKNFIEHLLPQLTEYASVSAIAKPDPCRACSKGARNLRKTDGLTFDRKTETFRNLWLLLLPQTQNGSPTRLNMIHPKRLSL